MNSNLGGRRVVQPMMVAIMVLATTVIMVPNMAYAGEELLVRKTLRFEECKQHITAVPASLGARPDMVSIVRDTGAEFKLKIAAQQANLVIGGNKVSDQMEVYRTTPGDAPQRLALSDG